MSPPETQNVIEFVCWHCRAEVKQDLQEVQRERMEIDYQEILPDPENPKRYHLRCPECGKFNTVYY